MFFNCLNNDNDDEGNRNFKLPDDHLKCRYDTDENFYDENFLTPFYSIQENIYRYQVPLKRVSWLSPYPNYIPFKFTSKIVYDYPNNQDANDPDIIKHQNDYALISFNENDKRFKCNRKSHHGPYKFMQFDVDVPVLVPCNPVGRTGVIGRGHLGRWGPNHAAEAIVTRWKRSKDGNKIIDELNKQPILQFIVILRKDLWKFEIPRGMKKYGENSLTTSLREFSEKILSQNYISTEIKSLIPQNNINKDIKNFFSSNNTIIYKGYIDDPRNTDNAWVETIVYNIHDDKNEFIKNIKYVDGDEYRKIKWIDISSSLDIHGCQYDYLYRLASLRNASW